MDEKKLLFRNRPALAAAVLLGILGAMGIVHHVRIAFILAMGTEAGLPLFSAEFLSALIVSAIAGFFASLVRETEFDGERSLVKTTFALRAGSRLVLTFASERAPLGGIVAVGIHFVFHGPARVFLKTRDAQLHAATFMMRDKKALEMGRNMAALLRVPFVELGNRGEEKRRIG